MHPGLRSKSGRFLRQRIFAGVHRRNDAVEVVIANRLPLLTCLFTDKLYIGLEYSSAILICGLGKDSIRFQLSFSMWPGGYHYYCC